MKNLLLLVFSGLLLCSCTGSKTATEEQDIQPEAILEVETTPEEVYSTRISVQITSSNPTGGYFQFDSTDTGWSGFARTFRNLNDTLEVLSNQPIMPREGWGEFNDMVNFLQIFTLPAQDEINDYDKNPLGRRNNPLNVQIEVNAERANGYENSYIYENPAIETGEYWQSANLITFLSYITTEVIVDTTRVVD
jgi:hypothetical protein